MAIGSIVTELRTVRIEISSHNKETVLLSGFLQRISDMVSDENNTRRAVQATEKNFDSTRALNFHPYTVLRPAEIRTTDMRDSGPDQDTDTTSMSRPVIAVLFVAHLLSLLAGQELCHHLHHVVL